MDLMTGRVIPRPKVVPVVMTDSVKKRVEEMAKKQGVKSLKFLNRYRQPLTPADMSQSTAEEIRGNLEIIDGNGSEFIDIEDDEHSAYLPSPDEDPADC